MPKYEHHRQHRFHTLRYGYRHWTWHQDGIRHPHHRKRKKNKRSKVLQLPERRFVTVLSLAFVVILTLLAAQAGWALWKAHRDINGAQGQLESILDNQDALLTPAGRAAAAVAVENMAQAATSASSTLSSSVGLDVFSVVPYVGTQVDGTKALVGDIADLAHGGAGLIINADNLAQYSTGTYVSLPYLDQLTKATGIQAIYLKRLIRPSAGLFGPIATARDHFNAIDHRIDRLLDKGFLGLVYTRYLLGANGPRTYFLAGENNAEMRDQGEVLSWALLHTDNGHYDVNGAKSVGDIQLNAPAPTPIPAGTAAVFGPLEPTTVWQSVNATGDFSLSGRFMTSMYASVTGTKVDGVVAVDVVALKSLLQLTGTVHVPEIRGPINSGNVEEILLHRLYQDNNTPSQDLRHDEVAAVAQAAVKKLNTTHVDVARLIKALALDVEQRHLLLYSVVPHYEAIINRFGAAGTLDAVDPENTFHLSVQSGVAAKLDYYTRTSSTMTVNVDGQGNAYVTTTVRIRNTAPANQPPSYQLGPDHTNAFTPGEYVARVYLWSPRGSTVFGPTWPESGLVLTWEPVTIYAQHTGVVTFQTVMPHAVKHGQLLLHLINQPTLVPAVTTVHVSAPQWHLRGPSTVAVVMSRDRIVSFDLN